MTLPMNTATFLNNLEHLLCQDRKSEDKSLFFKNEKNEIIILKKTEASKNLKKISAEKTIEIAKDCFLKASYSSSLFMGYMDIGVPLKKNIKRHYYSGVCGFFRKLFRMDFDNSTIGKQLNSLIFLEERHNNITSLNKNFLNFIIKSESMLKEGKLSKDETINIEDFFIHLQEKNQEEDDDKKNELKDSFRELFELVKNDPEQTKAVFMQLLSAHADDPDLCMSGITLLVKNIVRVLKEPKTKEPGIAISYYFEEFKIQAVKNLIRDQEHLSVYFKDGSEEKLEDCVSRSEILKVILTSVLRIISKSSGEQLCNLNKVISIDGLKKCKYIFPMISGENDLAYAKRILKLKKMPFEVLQWPMHDTNKIALALEMVKDTLQIKKEELGASDLKTIADSLSSDLVDSSVKKKLIDSIYTHYYTKEQFIKYLHHRITYAPEATQLKNEMINVLYKDIEDIEDPIVERLIVIDDTFSTNLTDNGLAKIVTKYMPEWEASFRN